MHLTYMLRTLHKFNFTLPINLHSTFKRYIFSIQKAHKLLLLSIVPSKIVQMTTLDGHLYQPQMRKLDFNILQIQHGSRK